MSFIEIEQDVFELFVSGLILICLILFLRVIEYLVVFGWNLGVSFLGEIESFFNLVLFIVVKL